MPSWGLEKAIGVITIPIPKKPRVAHVAITALTLTLVIGAGVAMFADLDGRITSTNAALEQTQTQLKQTQAKLKQTQTELAQTGKVELASLKDTMAKTGANVQTLTARLQKDETKLTLYGNCIPQEVVARINSLYVDTSSTNGWLIGALSNNGQVSRVCHGRLSDSQSGGNGESGQAALARIREGR